MNIDDHIRQAQEKGAFDNLPGQGKPIYLDNNPYAGGQELSLDILQQAGFLPNWLEERQAIEADTERAINKISRAWARVSGDYRRDPLWQKAEKKFRQESLRLNQAIRTYNLKAPAGMPHLIELNVERELVKLRRLSPIH